MPTLRRRTAKSGWVQWSASVPGCLAAPRRLRKVRVRRAGRAANERFNWHDLRTALCGAHQT